nr:extracellular solute-binding protein [Mesorhizobium sp. NBSH29]
MQGEPALPADFDNFPYVNPDAPKGGTVNYTWLGTFDSINPFIIQGSGARGSIDADFGNNVFDSLMQRSRDEAFTLYPLIAKTVETDEARSFVEFTLDERATFSDGKPITPDDVIFTFELLRDKGYPRYGVMAKKIDRVEKVGERGVRFTFVKPDRELPLLLGLLSVLPKHAIDADSFDKSTLTPIIGSGPYRLTNVKPGDSLTFTRNPDYWAKDIPSKRGYDNYDEIRMTYYRDENAMFEAFKKGLIDVLIEENSGRWANDYGFPAVTSGDVVRETLKTRLPSGMFGFVMNTRRPPFDDVKLRRALTGLFDFEWANRNLLSSAYTRTKSFYDNSDLSTHGRPASAGERAFLAQYRDAVTPEIMEQGWQPPTSDGTGRDRAFLKAGFDALKEAGYTIKDGKMIGKSGTQLGFEILLKSRENEQLAIAWQQTLQRVGIAVTIRSVDAAQYQQRLTGYDFDIITMRYLSSLSPGIEQTTRWGSATRDAPGTYNYAGVADPALDAALNQLVTATDRTAFEDAVRASDRILLSGAYVVPFYFKPEQWVPHWKRLARPETVPLYGATLPSWWQTPN